MTKNIIKESKNSIRFVIGDETVIEITPDDFKVNGIGLTFRVDHWHVGHAVSAQDLYSAFRAYQERCRDREALNN